MTLPLTDQSNVVTEECVQTLTSSESDEKVAKLQQELFSAAKADDLNAIQNVIQKVENQGLAFTHLDMCDPDNQMNVLHFALHNQAMATARELITTQKPELLMQQFEVIVRKMPSQKTSLCQLTEIGDLELIKLMLSRISDGEAKDVFIKQTVLMEPAGQRPRNLSSIHIAALFGHTSIVEYLIDLNISVNTINIKNDTPVLWAARGNHIETVKRLIELGADLSHQNDKGSTPLYWACRYGFDELVEVLIKEGHADIHQQRKLGLFSPIVLTAALGYTNIVEILLRNGANVNLRVQNGYTPLHHAAENGNDDTIEVLLEHGAQINEETDFGDNALQLAAAAHEIDALGVLAANGADIENINKDGKSVWHYAIDAPDQELLAVVVKWYKKLKKMPQGKLILCEGKTPLHIAAMREDDEKLQCLLDLGAESDVLDEAGNTFFHLAARENSLEVVNKFIDSVSVNAQNREGDTALHMATRNGHFEMVRVLVKKIKVDITNNDGETALHVACKSHKTSAELVDHLVDIIVKAHNWSLVDCTDRLGNTALHIAARSGRAEIMQSLRPLNPKVANQNGDSPLHLATKGGQADVLDAMLQIFAKEMQINQQNADGDTLLHIAAKHGDASMVELLIMSGADLAVRNKLGNTALHLVTSQSVVRDDQLNLYLEVFNTIVNTATRWWCMQSDLNYPDEDSEVFEKYRHSALLYLTGNIANIEGLTVLLLAARIGAMKIMETLLQTPDVYMFREHTEYQFDITSITPDTHPSSGSKEQSLNMMVPESWSQSSSSVSPLKTEDSDDIIKQSCLELIVHSENIQVANAMLDIIPIQHIVRDYWNAYQYIYGALMLVHLLNMGLFSAYSIPLLSSATLPVNITLTRGSTTIHAFPYGLFLIWPLTLLLYEMYYILNTVYHSCKKLDGICKVFSDKRKPKGVLSLIGNLILLVIDYLSHVSCVSFACLVIAWYILYLLGNIYQVHILATALIVGWLFSVVFTAGFEAVHSFSIMVKNVIIRDMTRFLFLYLFVLFAFSFAFEALFYLSDDMRGQYPSIWHMFFVVFNMMIGMGEIFSEDFDTIFSNLGLLNVGQYARFVYIFYIVLTTIILLNLLIAMMTDSYAAVKAREGTTWRVGSIQLAIQLERAMPFIPKFFIFIGIKKNPVTFDVDTKRWLMHIPESEINLYRQVRTTETMKALGRLEKEMSHLRATMLELAEKVDILSSTMDHGGPMRPSTPRLLHVIRNKRQSNLTTAFR